MWIFIEATDVWLFRDGRPFDAGADHRAASIFPPAPTTIQGAIRTKLLALYNTSFTDYAEGNNISSEITDQIGTADNGQPGQMQFRGPFLARRQADNSIMPYFPRPADILQVNSDKVQRLVPLRPDNKAPFAANWPDEVPYLQPCLYDVSLVGDDKPEGGQAWISAVGMRAYLAGKISTDNFSPPGQDRGGRNEWLAKAEAELNTSGYLGHVHLKPTTYFFRNEYRLGIGIEEVHKRPSDGKLYTATFVRPHNDVGLLVEVTGLLESKWSKAGILSLGGERKSARYSLIDKPAHWPTHETEGNKLYLATPTHFDGGWQTNNWQNYFSNAGQLTAACVSRPQMIGGWDMAQNRPKPMQRYVPAGCVYFFDSSLQRVNDEPICDDKDAGQIGFGTTFIGRY